MLLRLSDGLVLEHGGEIRTTCRRLSFAAGEAFINQRLVALLAVRDAHGMLPGSMARELEFWREAMSNFAGAGRD